MNRLESLNSLNKLLNEEKINLFEKEYENTIHKSFRTILNNYNVAKPRLTYFKNTDLKIEFNLNYLLGFSEKEYQDFPSCHKIYFERIPDNMLAIGSVDGGDLLCMDNNSGEIYYWFHEVNDWGLEGDKEYPTKVSSCLNEYLELLIASELPSQEELKRVETEGRTTYTSDDFDDLFAEYLIKK